MKLTPVVTSKYDDANRQTDLPQNGLMTAGLSVCALHGAFQSCWLGSGVVRTFAFNTRLQPTEIADSVESLHRLSGCSGDCTDTDIRNTIQAPLPGHIEFSFGHLKVLSQALVEIAREFEADPKYYSTLWSEVPQARID